MKVVLLNYQRDFFYFEDIIFKRKILPEPAATVSQLNFSSFFNEYQENLPLKDIFDHRSADGFFTER